MFVQFICWPQNIFLQMISIITLPHSVIMTAGTGCCGAAGRVLLSWNLFKHNPQMLISISLINIKIPRSQCKGSSLTTMWRHCFTVHYADSSVLCSVQAGVSLCRLTSSQLRCRGCTATGPRNHWRAETSECAALTRVTELPRIAAPVRGNVH